MPVKQISRSTFVRALRRRFPRRIDGYFAYDIFHPRHIIVTTDAPESVLYARFSEFCSSIPFHGTFVLFPVCFGVRASVSRSGQNEGLTPLRICDLTSDLPAPVSGVQCFGEFGTKV